MAKKFLLHMRTQLLHFFYKFKLLKKSGNIPRLSEGLSTPIVGEVFKNVCGKLLHISILGFLDRDANRTRNSFDPKQSVFSDCESIRKPNQLLKNNDNRTRNPLKF